MQFILNSMVSVLGLIIITSAFVFIFHPKLSVEIMKRFGIPFLGLIVFLCLISEQFGNAAGIVLLGLFSIASVIAYQVLQSRRRGNRTPYKAGGGERKPVFPHDSNMEDNDEDL
jgi:hypothetical protein